MLDNKLLGERFKTARQRIGLKARPFAIKGGIDISQYSKIERGEAGLSREKISEVAKIHGINMDFITTGKGPILIGEEEVFEKTKVEPTMKEILMVLAKGFTAQAETLKSIESKMARQDSQANIEANLGLVLETLRTVAVRQEADEEIMLASLSRLEGDQENKLFEDVGRRKSQIENLARMYGTRSATSNTGMENP